MLKRHGELGYAAVSVFPLEADYLDGQRLPAGIKPSEWDGFHDMILWDELMRGGSIASIFIGLVVGAPPIRHYGSQFLKDK